MDKVNSRMITTSKIVDKLTIVEIMERYNNKVCKNSVEQSTHFDVRVEVIIRV